MVRQMSLSPQPFVPVINNMVVSCVPEMRKASVDCNTLKGLRQDDAVLFARASDLTETDRKDCLPYVEP